MSFYSAESAPATAPNATAPRATTTADPLRDAPFALSIGMFDGVLVTRRLNEVVKGVVICAAVVVIVCVPLTTVVTARLAHGAWPMLTPKYGPVWSATPVAASSTPIESEQSGCVDK